MIHFNIKDRQEETIKLLLKYEYNFICGCKLCMKFYKEYMKNFIEIAINFENKNFDTHTSREVRNYSIKTLPKLEKLLKRINKFGE